MILFVKFCPIVIPEFFITDEPQLSNIFIFFYVKFIHYFVCNIHNRRYLDSSGTMLWYFTLMHGVTDTIVTYCEPYS